MTVQTQIPLKTLYDQDYYLWLQNTIHQLNLGQISSLDLDNLIEESYSVTRDNNLGRTMF